MKLTHALCNEFFSQYSITEKRTICLIMASLAACEKKHPKWPKDHIHQAAIVAEESGELMRATLQHKYEGGRFYEMHNEAAHTGAMAIRFIKNMPNMRLPGGKKETEPKYQKK